MHIYGPLSYLGREVEAMGNFTQSNWSLSGQILYIIYDFTGPFHPKHAHPMKNSYFYLKIPPRTVQIDGESKENSLHMWGIIQKGESRS